METEHETCGQRIDACIHVSKDDKSGDDPWSIELNFSRIVISWTIFTVTLLVVFFCGLSAGREQGINHALSTYGQESIRMPIPRAVAPNVESTVGPSSVGEVSKQLGIGNSVTAAVSRDTDAPKYDFSNSTVSINSPVVAKDNISLEGIAQSSKRASHVKEVTNGKVTAGFATRPAGSVVPTRGRLSRETGGMANRSQNVLSKKAETKKVVDKKITKKHVSTKLKAGKATKSVNILVSGYYIQVGAYRRVSEAENVCVSLRKAGQSPVLQKATVRKKRFYRVVLGPYPNKGDSKRSLEMLKGLKVSAGEPFLRYVEK